VADDRESAAAVDFFLQTIRHVYYYTRVISTFNEDRFMSVHPLAGKPAPVEILADIPRLIAAFSERHPDPNDSTQRVSFGTSGHRGTSLNSTFNADHIVAICQAILEYRRAQEITGPLIVGKDTHALSDAAFTIAMEVFTANAVDVVIDLGSPYTPTPVISHAILRANQDSAARLADGVIITPSHNPPEDGGIKYNPPDGGPADTAVTAAIETRANEILTNGLGAVRRAAAREAADVVTTQRHNLRADYLHDLRSVVDMDAIAASGIRIGVDPLGGSSLQYWDRIADIYGLNLEVVNAMLDPAFSFMRLDWDGRIRMDCSSPYAMAGLIEFRDQFDIAVGLDPDADRHGIVTRSAGLMNPNHYLVVAIWYLFQHRPAWKSDAGIGKTLVSSAMIDRVAARLGRPLVEVPVGFKWFVRGLQDGTLGFVGEESAGATFLRRDGSPWTTDKDGILLCLLAAEITAKTGREPAELYRELETTLGSPAYRRIDAPATPAQKSVLKTLSPDAIRTPELAGEKILAKQTRASGNGAAIGGLKVATENGWFAARPSGTENVYKIYAESFLGEDHLRQVIEEARMIVADALRAAGGPDAG
jgi:phosphoglucomutase